MKDKINYMLPIIVVSILAFVFIESFYLSAPTTITTSPPIQISEISGISGSENSAGITYKSLVTVEINRAGTDYWQPWSQSHNFFSGKDMVEDRLSGTGDKIVDIAIGNDTNSAGMVQNYFDSGLVNLSTGTTTRIAAGNWSIVTTFTSTANNKDVNATGLFNGTTTGPWSYFAGNNFTKVTLQNGDSIQVTWNISIS